MRVPMFVVLAAAGLWVLSAVPAAGQCCARHDAAHANHACCDAAARGQHQELDAVAVLMAMDQDVPAEPSEPGRQTLVTWFHQPSKVGDRILFGKYIIEHDNARMARGDPCTHIYAAEDPRLPVVAFHCTHLDRPQSERASVIVQPMNELPGMTALVSFQFAGESGAHGVPR